MSNSTPKRILFLVPYPLRIAPSQRFRFEQYFSILEQASCEYQVRPFLSGSETAYLYEDGIFRKVFQVLKGLISRLWLLLESARFDFVFIHREAAPIGPPIIEWFIAKVMRKKIIFDFDDAVWLENTSHKNQLLRHFKRYQNVKYTCSCAYKVSVGNEYLKNFALRYNQNVCINPTTIDTDGLHNRVKQFRNNKIVFGWTGTHSTLKYLDSIVELFRKLEACYDFEFLVISDKNPKLDLKSFKHIRWNRDSEISDLLKFDVGIMPLYYDNWAKGKCGFKALQYMALGIPAIASPVGVNTQIIDHNVNGWLCDALEDWEYTLKLILDRTVQPMDMSVSARKKVVEHFSVKSNTSNFLHLFDNE